jgi:hypothetical protein
MNEGPGSVVSIGGAGAIQDLKNLPAGSRVNFDRDSYDRTLSLEPDEVAIDFYRSVR